MPAASGYNLCLVGQAVGHATVFNGLNQLGHGCLPLGTACAGVSAGHLALGNSHSYLTISSNNNLVFGICTEQAL